MRYESAKCGLAWGLESLCHRVTDLMIFKPTFICGLTASCLAYNVQRYSIIMVPEKLLPYPPGHISAEDYVEALLDFITTSDLLQTLCGGVHILDFLVREPDLYETVLPLEWRNWLRPRELPDVLDLLMRENIDVLLKQCGNPSSYNKPESQTHQKASSNHWRGGPLPPQSLLQYIGSVRILALDRSYHSHDQLSEAQKTPNLSRQIAVGMKPKKAHEVVNFAAFIDEMVSDLASTNTHDISHLVDFGSGQNYLGRVLASPLYGKSVIAVESKQSNINGAREMDVSAKLAKREVILRNKKEYRMEDHNASVGDSIGDNLPEQSPSIDLKRQSDAHRHRHEATKATPGPPLADHRMGQIQYVEHMIVDGNLTVVTSQLDRRRNEERMHDRIAITPIGKPTQM